MSTPTTTDANKVVVQNFLNEVINQRNVAAIPDFFAADGGGTCGGTRFEEVVRPFQIAEQVGAPAPAAAEGEPAAAAATRPARPSQSIQAMQAFTSQVLAAFPNLQVRIDSMVAEGDTVVVRWSGSGTQTNTFFGRAATGQVVPMSSVDVFTLQNGKITSLVSRPDTVGALTALGVLPLAPMERIFRLAGEDAPADQLCDDI